MLLKPPKTFGLVLNISLRMADAVRVSDMLKEELVPFVCRFDEEDLFYLNDLVDSNGKRTAALGNWQPQEVSPSLREILPKAMRIVTEYGDVDGDWYFCFVTDRYKANDEKQLQIALQLNGSNWGGLAKVMVITLGNSFDFKEYERICKEYECHYVHLRTPEGLGKILMDWTGMEEL